MAKVCLPGAVDCSRSLAPTLQSPPPINFFYEHFHNSIRTELDSLSRTVAKLTSAPEGVAADLLHVLQNRYKFLEQVYTYHSSVEDEVSHQGQADSVHAALCTIVKVVTPHPVQVVYPALDCKVRNVTSAYTVEHEHEVRSWAVICQVMVALPDNPCTQQLQSLALMSCRVACLRS